MGGKKFSIIGGDLRNVKLAELIAADGNSVNIYGFSDAEFEIKFKQSDTLAEAISGSDVVIGPLPCSNDAENINAPYNNEKIHINEVFKCITKNQLFIAGRISEKIVHMAKVYNVYTVDVLEREEMAVLNSIPTAEGAIQIAMEEMPITLHNSQALILGYGRIGKTLSKMLHGIGANVYVEARKYSDLAWIKSCGYNPVVLSELPQIVKNINVLFNTIPSIVLNKEILELMNPDCLIIDLASKPGGVDFEKAREIGLKAIWALSLPGKVAPVTAAEFIRDTAYNIIEELGV